ncbi:hypothetical protein [Mycolicibacterium sp. PDY-3]|uniref:hypothetical protein n=1 Tax=Mycolicibacterium sp. PDY-3 TaxID=3376069 RepID=UPI0037A01B9E
MEPLKVGDEFEDGTVVRIIRTNKDGSQVLELNTGRIAVRGNGVEITADRDYTE